MAVKRIDAPRLDDWVEGLCASRRVIGVQAAGDRFAFAPLSSAAQLRLDHDVTVLPPGKLCFLPPRETLLRFRDVQFESVFFEGEPFVLLGVHPYDVAAIRQMDRIFARDHCDTHYMRRRAAATIVACDVEQPSEDVFAGCMGTAVVEDGFDVLLTRIGESYLVDARTEKGRALVAPLADAPDATEDDLRRREQVWEENRRRLRKHELKVEPERLPEVLASEAAAGHPVWKEQSELCFSCASCNAVCPTCYCFDVRDEANWDLRSGERLRCWDGCLLERFARVAGGHNFRPERYQRYRHRYYRKGKYIPEMIGECGCVGCGRCIAACVAKIANPVTVFNRLLEVA